MRCFQCGREITSGTCAACGFCLKDSTVLLLSKLDPETIVFPIDDPPIDASEEAASAIENTSNRTSRKKASGNLIPLYIAASIAAIVLLLLWLKPSHSSGTVSPGNAVSNRPTSPSDSVSSVQNSGGSQSTVHTHVWVDATCTAPKTCQLCGMQSGDPAPHQWKVATYSSPTICQNCLSTVGISLGTPVTQLSASSDSQSKYNTDITVGRLKDNSGVTYDDALRFWVSDGPGLINMEYIVYQLGGSYDILNASIAIGADSDKSAAVRFRIYGDDRLLYQSGYISSTQSENFQVDVTGVYSLRIECETYETCRYSYGLLSATVHVK